MIQLHDRVLEAGLPILGQQEIGAGSASIPIFSQIPLVSCHGSNFGLCAAADGFASAMLFIWIDGSSKDTLLTQSRQQWHPKSEM